jgi:hypothetical protein
LAAEWFEHIWFYTMPDIRYDHLNNRFIRPQEDD